MEAQLSALKSYINCELSTINNKLEPKNSFRRELRNSKESVNFESEDKFQSLYCIDESATENEFSTLPEDTCFCKNQSVIPSRRRQVVLNNHPEKQTVFVNKKFIPGEASYTVSSYKNRKKAN